MLNLDHNHITQLPNMTGLTALREVSLSYNQITIFPAEFSGLKNLNMLDLSHNKITTVPDVVKMLHVLELNLNQNQVSSFSLTRLINALLPIQSTIKCACVCVYVFVSFSLSLCVCVCTCVQCYGSPTNYVACLVSVLNIFR